MARSQLAVVKYETLDKVQGNEAHYLVKVAEKEAVVVTMDSILSVDWKDQTITTLASIARAQGWPYSGT